MYSKQRGSVTVFLCIVLAAIIPLSCLLTDLARFNMAKKQAKTALKITVESILAAYDRQLREQYGLFSIYPRDLDSMEKEIFDLLSDNLNVGVSAEGASDIYGFNVRSVKAIPFYNLSEPDVLEQQIAEFMKYRAPVQIIQEFYEKIKLMIGVMEEVEMIEDKMEVDRLMNDIREYLVRLHYMINDICSDFNVKPGNVNQTLKDDILNSLKWYQSYIEVLQENSNDETENIKEARKGYIDNYDNYEIARKNKEHAEQDLDSVNNKLDSKQKQLDNVKENLNKENEKEEKDQGKITSLNKKIADLEEEIEKLGERKEIAQATFDSANAKYNEIYKIISEYKNKLNNGLDKVIENLNTAIGYIEYSSYEISILLKHIKLHTSYQKDNIDISKEIIPKLDELEDKSNKLLDKTANNSGTVADRIGGNLNEQLKLIHVDSYNEFLTQFENNCNKLETWKSDIENCLDTLNGEKDKILDVVKTAIAIKDRPQDTKNNLDKINIETGINKLDNNLSDLKELGRMDNVYKLPDFKLNPEPNEIEENQFKKCFYDKYFDQITEEIEKDLNTPDPKKDDAQLNSVKNDAIDLADVIVNQEEAQSSKELNKDELPSEHGPISSEKALEEIALLLEKSALNYIVSEEFISNPFLEPHQGLDSIDEKEKSFFDYEVEKIKKLFELIKDILKNGIELLVESLYMNEYIVSSFKCASVQNNVIKNDIGWNRPLDSTFFDKGEVEYILFGKAKEATNINLSKTSIFAIRLAFNLLHVYTDPVKLSQTLSWATAIAGWTIFGVPVVQNLLLILWAAAESYVDMSILFKGEHVSMIKTSSSWYVSLENLKGEALKDIKNFAQNQVEKLIDNIENAVKETLDGIIDAKIDKLFEPFEKGLEKTTGSAANSIENIGNDFTQNIIKNMKFDNAEIFASTLETALKNGIESIKNKVENLGRNALADFKDKFKQEIKDAIFGSYLFDGLVEEIKEVGNSLIDKGFNAVSEQIDNALGSPGNSSSNNIAGRFIMMDYEDYLRLMLFTVTKNNKSLRTADLIQTNMTAFKGENVYISDYCTYIFVRAEVDFNPWFIPEYFFKSKNNLGMISVEWSQGY